MVRRGRARTGRHNIVWTEAKSITTRGRQGLGFGTRDVMKKCSHPEMVIKELKQGKDRIHRRQLQHGENKVLG